jgi:hypothetical protein
VALSMAIADDLSSGESKRHRTECNDFRASLIELRFVILALRRKLSSCPRPRDGRLETSTFRFFPRAHSVGPNSRNDRATLVALTGCFERASPPGRGDMPQRLRFERVVLPVDPRTPAPSTTPYGNTRP